MDHTLIAQLLIALSTLLGLYVSVSRLKAGFKQELAEETEKAIDLVKATGQTDVAILKGQIENLTREITRLEDSFKKDVSHIRETYNSEIRNLGHKIEELREEVRGQHSQLVTLLTKLVSER